MTDDISFAEILNTPMEAFNAPVALPTGTYLCLVVGQPRFGTAGENNTNCVDVNLQPLQAGEGVDQDKLAEILNGASLSEKMIKHRMFVTKDSAYRLRRFLVDDLGIEPSTFNQMIPEGQAGLRQAYPQIFPERPDHFRQRPEYGEGLGPLSRCGNSSTKAVPAKIDPMDNE